MTLSVIYLSIFLSVATIVAAACMLLRDLIGGRGRRSDHRLGLSPSEAEKLEMLPPPPISYGRIDRLFYRMIDESGTRLDAPTALAVVGGAAVIGGAAPWIFFESLLGAAGGFFLGALVPILWLSIRRWRRMRTMRMQLPEALQIIADNVRSGRTIEQATQMAAAELKDPLAAEFDSCSAKLKLGHSAASVLQTMARRIPLPEFRIFTTAVLVHQRAGGNLALLTQRLARSARDRQELDGHLNAVSAGSRISAVGLVVGSALGMAALAWIEPEYASAFLTTEIGPFLLALAIGLQLTGAFWVWKTLRIRY